jgi:hypothetical protein
MVSPRERRARRALSVCRRNELATGDVAAPAVPSAFLRALNAFDPLLELYWHPHKKKYYLYRVFSRGGAACDDKLVKEAEVCGPGGEYRHPGPWLLARLREWELTAGGQFDYDKAKTSWLDSLYKDDVERMEEEERYLRAADLQAIEGLRMCAVGRDSIVMPKDIKEGELVHS